MKNLGLTVVTHTVKSWNRDLSRCIESVRAALPSNASHIIIETDEKGGLIKPRYDAISLNDIVVFVDDDDYISPDSLEKCVDALSKNDVGLAFTNEVLVTDTGNTVRNNTIRYCNEICTNPEIVHHMCAYRTKYVTERSINLALLHNSSICIEWIMKADAMSMAGAIYVPINGYFWLQHKKQSHRSSESISTFKHTKSVISKEISTWFVNNDEILKY